MKILFLSLLLLCAASPGAAPAAEHRFFPYPYTIDDLPNGLRLITVPTDNPNLIALYLVVQTGSRNEVEPGKSGYAHFFEHMMFRGSEHFTGEQRDVVLRRAGAAVNAYTSDDRTVYHTLFPKEDLESIMEIEADRFERLKYSLEAYKTETRAVLGEYNKNSANPYNKLYEVLRAAAFTKHTYKHTTMGFLEDIEAMPNQFDYSLEFYRRHYRPEYTTLLLVGDLTRDRALDLTRKYFGEWQRGNYVPQIPAEPPQTEPRTAHVDWPSPTLPFVVVAFHGPAYSDEKMDKAALDLLAVIGFGENSELYQRLGLKEQKVDVLSPAFDDQPDPELFSVVARIKDRKDLDYVRDQITATFKRYTTELIPDSKLKDTRAHLRYGTALGWTSSGAIANFLAPYVALRRTPETIDKLFSLYDRVTPEVVRELAARYFTENSRTIVTLATKSSAKEGAK